MKRLIKFAAAGALACAPFTVLALAAPMAHACPGLNDGGMNTAAAHNACCMDIQLGAQGDGSNCGAGPVALPPAPPPQQKPLGPCPGGHSPLLAPPCN
jgi:hypothetical protein